MRIFIVLSFIISLTVACHADQLNKHHKRHHVKKFSEDKNLRMSDIKDQRVGDNEGYVQ